MNDMKIKLQHVEGYSPVDHLGPTIVHWAEKCAETDTWPNVQAAKQAAITAIVSYPAPLRQWGLPRIDAISEDGALRVRVL